MKILKLTANYPNSYNQYSGIYVKDQVESISQNGVEVFLVGTISISVFEIIRQKKIKFGFEIKNENNLSIILFLVPSIPKLKIFNHIIRHSINKLILHKLKNKNKFDCIHCHSYLAGKTALWFSKKINKPLIITEHSSIFTRNLAKKFELKIAKKTYSKANKNIAVSQNLAKELKCFFNVNFDYIPNIVDTNFFAKNSIQDNRLIQFISVGNLDENKNQILLIKGFEKAFKGKHNVKLKILGNGINHKMLNSYIKNNKLENQINLFGYANRKQIKEIMSESNALVITSKYETFGIVAIEALSMGLPVITSKCGGVESIIINDKLGLYHKNTETDLAEKLLLFKTKINDYNHSYLRDYVVNNFSSKIISKKLINLYNTI